MSGEMTTAQIRATDWLMVEQSYGESGDWILDDAHAHRVEVWMDGRGWSLTVRLRRRGETAGTCRISADGGRNVPVAPGPEALVQLFEQAALETATR
jgi:hypothetical protein